MQRSALCRSRRELSNEYLLAKIGVDTAENEPCKVCPLSVYRSPRCSFSPEACRDVVAAVRRMVMRWGQRWGQHEKEVIRPDKCDNEAFVAEIFPAAKS